VKGGARFFCEPLPGRLSLLLSSFVTELERIRLDREIKEACGRGDMEAAATIALRGYGPEILGFLMGVHRDETAAADSFAEFAEGLWRGLPSFGWESSFRTWAYAIARNVTRLAFRRAARHKRRGRLVGLSSLDRVAERVRTATLTFLRTEKRSKFDDLKESLSEEDRALLILRVDRGLGWKDLARVLSDGKEALDDVSMDREVARLRKRYQLAKERLHALARKNGLIT
jgi:RNA polymerase sigma-70 factor, ECF subfamily